MVYKEQMFLKEVTGMEHERDPKQDEQQDFSFDQSVCSPEFPDGCTLPVSEQDN